MPKSLTMARLFRATVAQPFLAVLLDVMLKETVNV
jgi:hypothetical protein